MHLLVQKVSGFKIFYLKIRKKISRIFIFGTLKTFRLISIMQDSYINCKRLFFLWTTILHTYFCFVISFPLDCVDPDDVTDVTLALGDPDGDFPGSISGSR